MGVFASCCRCGKRIAAAGLIGLVPVCEACEFVHRAEPPPPPPAVREEEPAQLHIHAEMDAGPLAVEPAAIAPSAVVRKAIPPRQVMLAQAEDYSAMSDGSAMIHSGQPPVVVPPPRPIIVRPLDVPMSGVSGGYVSIGYGGRRVMVIRPT
jgi:hypothetical protein